MGKRRNHVSISYKNLRRLIGILGLSLPVMCLAGLLFSKIPIQPSISHFYYTNVRDIFTGVIIGVSMFLVTYNGYNKIDDWITNITGIFGFGIALCPCFCINNTVSKVGFLNLSSSLSDAIHLTSAAFFFLLLAINSIFLFTKTSNRALMTKHKKRRNVLYITCGVIMIISLLLIFILRLTLGEFEFNNKPIVFSIESAMLIAFGISWLVKGETMCRDKAVRAK